MILVIKCGMCATAAVCVMVLGDHALGGVLTVGPVPMAISTATVLSIQSIMIWLLADHVERMGKK